MNRPSFFTWRPQTTYVLIGGFVVLLIGLVVSYVLANFTPTTPVKLAGGVYHLWVADTEALRTKGLSGVKKLDPNGGLLMKFDRDDKWGIWMKDMHVPLDILWLNKDKKVIYIVKDARPDMSTNVTFIPKDEARYVIELPEGSVKKAGIKTGTVAEFDETSTGGFW